MPLTLKALAPRLLYTYAIPLEAGAKGFVLAISRRWKEPEYAYRKWSRENKWVHFITKKKYDKKKGAHTVKDITYSSVTKFGLGRVIFIKVEEDIEVANMVAQGDMVDYSAVDRGLRRIARRAKKWGRSLHMPRIGCGLGGGKWEEIEPLIIKHCEGLEVFVYDLPE